MSAVSLKSRTPKYGHACHKSVTHQRLFHCFIFLISSTNSNTPTVSIQHVIYLTSERYRHSSYKHSENYLNDYGKPVTFMFLIFHVSGVWFMSVRPDQVTNDRITQSLQPPLTVSVPHLALCSSAAEAVTDKSTVDNCYMFKQTKQ